MSAFLVSRETMHRAVAAIEQSSDRFGAGPLGHLPDAKAMSALGRQLYKMNVDALRQRYPAQRFCPPANYAWRSRPIDPLSGFFALDCLLYQCTEGNVPETPLYQAAARVRDGLARVAAHDAANAKNVPWDWPELGA